MNKTFRDTKPRCPPCMGHCNQGRTCPWNQLPEPEEEDQSEGLTLNERLQVGAGVAFIVCLVGAVASCVVSR